MALYLPDQNALFLHVPRTGGRFVAKTLQETLGLNVREVGYEHSHKDAIGLVRFRKQPFTFAFVRNPVTWYASYWQGKVARKGKHWAIAEPDTLWHPAWPIDPLLGSDDFDEFINNVCNRPGFLHEMFRLYTGRGTQDQIHYIGKQETLVEDLSTILDTIGVAHDRKSLAAAARVNASRGDAAPYTPDLEAMVQQAELGVLEDYAYDVPTLTNVPTPRPGPDLGPRTKANREPTLDDVPGWFRPVDRDLFRLILEWQTASEPAGDIVELGAYLGKSAILLGQCLQQGETLTVCDLFGMPAPDDANASEADSSYGPLDRQGFERNYLKFHESLPVVLQMPTSGVLDHVKPDTARFIHVDASHLYEHVATDIESSRTMLRKGGVIVFDDYQSLHTPGVAAAVWGEMATGGLKPIALTAKKWYGTWDDPAPIREMIRAWVADQSDYRLNVQYIAGHEVLRVVVKDKKAEREAKDAG